DHADTDGVRVVRRSDLALAAAHDDLARVGRVVSDQALHEGALAGAVLAQERRERAGRDAQRDAVERREGAEALGHAEHFDVDGPPLSGRRRGGSRHHAGFWIAAMKSAERDTAPKTPPCIVTILIAAL